MAHTITLAIDTSTSAGSVAAIGYKQVVFHEQFTAARNHSSTLFRALERARSHLAQVDVVAVGLGPGSYAGIRVAISATLGFQMAFGATCVGIPSVAAFDVEEETYIAIGDARRESFYFTLVENGICSEGPMLATEREVRERLGRHAAMAVYATEKLPAFPTVRIAHPSAARIARMAFNDRGIVQRGDLEPI